MEKRELGNSGIKVSPLVFGGNVFGWTADEKTSFDLLDAFTDKGFDFIDTADVYSTWVPGNHGGESESIIGNWLSKTGNRKKMTIATKVGKPMGEDKRGLSKAYITKAVEDSLTRLQTDYIDIYFAHFDDNQILLTETLECFTELIKQGKVRAIGASNYTADRLRKSLNVSSKSGLARYECLQPEYNLYDREGYENGLEEICVKNNIGVISYYGLASGFLTGKYRSEDDLTKSNRGKGIRKYLNDRGHRILKVLDELSKEYNTTPAAIALAWVIARPSITAPIASATSVEQLNEITKAVDLKLGQVAISMLNRASSY